MKTRILSFALGLVAASNAQAADCWYAAARGAQLTGTDLKVTVDIPCANYREDLDKKIVYLKFRSRNEIAIGFEVRKTSCNWGILNMFEFHYDVVDFLRRPVEFFDGAKIVGLKYEEYVSYDYFQKCDLPPPVPKDRYSQ